MTKRFRIRDAVNSKPTYCPRRRQKSQPATHLLTPRSVHTINNGKAEEEPDQMVNSTPLSVSRPSRDHYDVIIVGSGMGGGTLAFALKDAGVTVLLIERGGFVPQEPQNWDPDAVFRQGRYKNAENWYDAEGRPFSPAPTTTSAATPSSTDRRWFGFATKTSNPPHIKMANPPPGRSTTTTLPRTTAAPKRSTTCTANSTTRPCSEANRSPSPESATNHPYKQ